MCQGSLLTGKKLLPARTTASKQSITVRPARPEPLAKCARAESGSKMQTRYQACFLPRAKPEATTNRKKPKSSAMLRLIEKNGCIQVIGANGAKYSSRPL